MRIMDDDDFIVLMAEDNDHDVLATRRAWKKNDISTPLVIVRDGEECMDYLQRRGKYAEKKSLPQPNLLLLDINMPKMSGLEVLEAIRQDDKLKNLPVVMLTTSDAEPDLKKSYDLGANAYIVKPVGFDNFSRAINDISIFWKRVKTP